MIQHALVNRTLCDAQQAAHPTAFTIGRDSTRPLSLASVLFSDTIFHPLGTIMNAAEKEVRATLKYCVRPDRETAIVPLRNTRHPGVKSGI